MSKRKSDWSFGESKIFTWKKSLINLWSFQKSLDLLSHVGKSLIAFWYVLLLLLFLFQSSHQMCLVLVIDNILTIYNWFQHSKIESNNKNDEKERNGKFLKQMQPSELPDQVKINCSWVSIPWPKITLNHIAVARRTEAINRGFRK